MKHDRSPRSALRALLCALALAAVLCGAVLPAFAEGLVTGTEIRVLALGKFELSRTEDFVLPEGGSQQLRAEASQEVEHWLWEVSTDGGATWRTIGTDAAYDIRDAKRNRDASGQDVPYQYRVTATSRYGETASEIINVLVSSEYDYRTITRTEQHVSASAYMHTSTRLVVTPIEDETAPVAQVLLARLAEGCLPLNLCDVELVNDNAQVVPFFGKVELSFAVGEQYNVQTLRVLHYNSETDTVEPCTAVVQDGRLTITVEQLGAFLVEVPDAGAHCITVEAGAGGSVLPGGRVTVADGADKTFVLLPDAGYEVDRVLLDGELVVSSGNRFVLQNIRADHVLTVTFKKVEPTGEVHTVLMTHGPHGYATPGTVQVEHGEALVLFFYPDPGYEVDTLRINDAEGQPVEYTVFGLCYTIPAVTEDLTIDVTFRKAESQLPQVYNKVTVQSGPGGKVSPGVETTVPYGGAMYFYFLPEDGFVLDTVYLDGKPVQTTGNCYQLISVVTPHTLQATFRPQAGAADATYYYTVTTENGAVQVPAGGTQCFYFTAQPAQGVQAVALNGEPQAFAGRAIALRGVQADTSITVTYGTPKAYDVGADCRCLWSKWFGGCIFCRWAGRCLTPWCVVLPLLLAGAAGAALWQRRRRKGRT